MSKEIHVYLITCNKSERQYVGVAGCIQSRWYYHCRDARTDTRPLYNAIRSFGADSFQIRSIGIYPTYEAAYLAEEFEISRLKEAGIKLFNVAGGGLGGKGRKYSDEQRERWKLLQKEIQNTPEALARAKEIHNRPDVKEKHAAAARLNWARRRIARGSPRPGDFELVESNLTKV